MMNLTLVDDLILLALDDDSGSFISTSTGFGYALAGAVLMELSIQEIIEVKDKKVELKSTQRTSDELLNYFLDGMRRSKKIRSIEHWISTIGDKESEIVKTCTDKLIRLGILKKEEKTFLWIFKYKKYPTLNSKHENRLRKRLNAIVESRLEPELNDVVLISLVDACELNVEVYGKEKAKTYKKKIKSIIERSKTNSAINATIHQVHDAIIASLVIMIATTTVVTSS